MSDQIYRLLIIHGSSFTDSFLSWIIHRAERLSLAGAVRRRNTQRVEMWVSGDRIMVEAMEVACSLGPFDVQVDTVEMQEITPSEMPGRHPRQFVRYSPEQTS